MNAGEKRQFENADTPVSGNEKSSTTTNISPFLGELLQRYNEAREAGKSINIDNLCQDFPGSEEDVRSY